MPVRLALVCFVILTVLGITWLLLDEGPAGGAGVALNGAAVMPHGKATLPEPGAVPQGGDGSEPARLFADDVVPPQDDEHSAALGIRPDGTVSGRVIGPAGTPLAGVPVLIYVTGDPWQDEFDGEELSLKLGAARTDAAGLFELPARSGAKHTLLAGGISWARERLVDVAASDQLIVRLEDPRWIEGVVREQETGEPVAGARVLVIAGAESLTGAADADGAFRLEPLAFENVIVAAWAPGYDVGLELGALTGWESVTVELPPGRDVVGWAVDRETSVPVAGAEVRFSMDVAARVAVERQLELEAREQTVFEQTVITDAAGMFVFSDVPSSGFTLDVTAEGFVPRQLLHYEGRSLESEEEVFVQLRRLEPVHGRVVSGPDQVRAPGALVELSAGGRVLLRTAADETGDFVLELEAWDGKAPLLVTAFGENGLCGVARVKTRDGEQELLVRLAEPVPLRVAVTAGDSLLAGAQVAVQAGSEPEVLTVVSTGSDGTVELVYARSSPDVQRLYLQARYAGRQSLQVELDLVEGPPAEAIVLDVEDGTWIEGVVMDAYGAPISGASVWARGVVGVHADFEGRFRLGPFEVGRQVKVGAVASGFRESRETVPELSDWMGELIITLEPIMLWAGRVVDSTTGFPIEKFLARLQRERDTDAGRMFTDTSAKVERTLGEPGEFTAELPSAGRYRMKVVSLDYIDTTSDVLLFDGKTQPGATDVFLSPAAVLLVTVVDSLGRPVPGFNVRVVEAVTSEDPKSEKQARKKSPSRRTDSMGIVRFNLGAGGLYRLASGSTGWIEPQQVKVTPGPAVQRTCQLPATGDLALTIVDETGALVNRPNVTVRARGPGRLYEVSRRSSPRATPEEVRFDVLPPGEYSVQVRARGFATLDATVLVIANRVQRERLMLRPAVSEPGRGAGGGRRREGGGRR